MKTEFKEREVIINNKKFFYWEKNEQKTKTVVLLHGLVGNHMGLVDLASSLSDDYHMILPDLPACGQSQDLNAPYSLKKYGDWLNDFLERVSVDKAVIVGHSFGSRVALVFAMKYSSKVEKLVLITPVTEVDGLIARLASLYYRIGGTLPGYMQKLWLANKFFKEVGDIILFKSSNKKMQNEMIQRDIDELKKINQQVIVELFDEFYHSKLIISPEKITAKTLVIASDKDVIATVKSVKVLVGQLGKPTFEIMKNSGHFVPLERPKALAKIIQNFLTTTI